MLEIWIVASATVVTLGLLPLAFVDVDEAWFLVVVRRLLRGDVLYKDVFFGVAPMPVWIATALARVTLPQAIVMRALDGFYLAIGLAASVLLVSNSMDQIAVALLVVALGGIHVTPRSHYGRFSLVLALAGAAAILNGLFIVAGVCVGLSILGKYTTGLAAAIALLLVSTTIAGVDQSLVMLAGAGLIVGVASLVLGRSGIAEFYASAVANKSVYVKKSWVGPIGETRRLIRDVARRSEWGVSVPGTVAMILLGVGFLAVLVGGYQGFLGDRDAALAGAAICAISIASSYPRFDRGHVAWSAPGLAVGVFMVFAGSDPLVLMAFLLGGIALLAGVMGNFGALRRIEWRSDLQSAKFLPVKRIQGVWPDDLDSLTASAGNHVFLVHRSAPIFYLTGGLTNPTRYDYPLSSTFGPRGQEAVVEALERREIKWVCHRRIGPPMGPYFLEEHLSAQVPETETGIGMLYRFGD